MEYFSDFVSHYAASGCGIRQQVLNLTNEEKKAIADAIYTNYEPQNRVYRYNYVWIYVSQIAVYYFPSCSTFFTLRNKSEANIKLFRRSLSDDITSSFVPSHSL